ERVAPRRLMRAPGGEEMITPSEAQPGLHRCRICGSPELSFAMDVECNGVAPGGVRRYLACGSCGSLLDAIGVPPPYDDGDQREPSERDPHIKFYLEVGAGIEAFAAFIWLLRRALEHQGVEGPRRLLEIGAGFGFTLSMAEWLGWE